jgi:hypothetical protein
MGIDYAVQTAIAQVGIPYCDEDCQKLIADKIKEVGKQVADSGAGQPACSSSGGIIGWATDGSTLYDLKPLCIPPGVSSMPVPGSMYVPATLQVRVTRTDGSPQVVPTEMLVIDSQAVNSAYGDGHSDWEYLVGYNGKWPYPTTNSYSVTYNEPLQGVAFPEAMITIPPLKAGQSINVPVIFSYPPENSYAPPNAYPPRENAIKNQYPNADLSQIWITQWWIDYKHLTDSGAQVTIQAQVHCADPSMPWIYISPCSNAGEQQFIAP